MENIESIMANGLRANEDGDIFLFENKSVGYHGISYNSRGKLAIGKVRRTIADNIAINQLGLMEKYAMFEISSEGISGSLINDNVAAITINFLIKKYSFQTYYEYYQNK